MTSVMGGNWGLREGTSLNEIPFLKMLVFRSSKILQPSEFHMEQISAEILCSFPTVLLWREKMLYF